MIIIFHQRRFLQRGEGADQLFGIFLDLFRLGQLVSIVTTYPWLRSSRMASSACALPVKR